MQKPASPDKAKALFELAERKLPPLIAKLLKDDSFCRRIAVSYPDVEKVILEIQRNAASTMGFKAKKAGHLVMAINLVMKALMAFVDQHEYTESTKPRQNEHEQTGIIQTSESETRSTSGKTRGPAASGKSAIGGRFKRIKPRTP